MNLFKISKIKIKDLRRLFTIENLITSGRFLSHILPRFKMIISLGTWVTHFINYLTSSDIFQQKSISRIGKSDRIYISGGHFARQNPLKTATTCVAIT